MGVSVSMLEKCRWFLCILYLVLLIVACAQALPEAHGGGTPLLFSANWPSPPHNPPLASVSKSCYVAGDGGYDGQTDRIYEG